MTVFTTIEIGLYTSVIASFVLLLVRIAHPRGHFLGRVSLRASGSSVEGPGEKGREVFVPLEFGSRSSAPGVLNEHLAVIPPAPGVVVYRLDESVIYPDAHRLNAALVDYVKENTRRGRDMAAVSLGDRAWNDPGQSRLFIIFLRRTHHSRSIDR